MTAPETLMGLAETFEKASWPDRNLFAQAYAACNGGRLFADPATPDFQSTHAEWKAFAILLADGAWLDAAMSLVPEGWNWMAGNRNRHDARAYVENGKPSFVGAGFRDNPERQWFEVVATTPALALCAAALRARAAQGEAR